MLFLFFTDRDVCATLSFDAEEVGVIVGFGDGDDGVAAQGERAARRVVAASADARAAVACGGYAPPPIVMARSPVVSALHASRHFLSLCFSPIPHEE